MKNAPVVTPELSRPLSVDRIPSGGMVEDLVARPDERKALAERFGLVELKSCTAHLNIDLVRAGKMVAVTGHLDADVVQQCVVTLEPVAAHIHADVDQLFAPPGLLENPAPGALPSDFDEEDAPDPIEHGTIDIGEVVAQHLAMELDPYPRLPGATLPHGMVEDDPSPDSSHPLAILKNLKVKTKK